MDYEMQMFIENCELEDIEVTVIRENADYYVCDLEGDIRDFRDVEWAVNDADMRTIHFKLYEIGYATITVGLA